MAEIAKSLDVLSSSLVSSAGRLSVAGIVILMLIAFLSFLAMWKPNPILFMILSAVSIVAGFSMPDIISDNVTTTELDITVAICLIAYGLISAAWSFRLMFWREEA